MKHVISALEFKLLFEYRKIGFEIHKLRVGGGVVGCVYSTD